MHISPTKDDALLVVDVQNDFLPGGSLAVPEGDLIVPFINSYAAIFTQAGLPVFASRDFHPHDHCSFAAQGGTWPPHCIADTHGSAFPAELKLPGNCTILSKAVHQDRDAYSAMDNTGLDNALKQLHIRRLFVCGLATDYCVHASVMDLLRAGYEVVLLTDAIRGVNIKPDDSARAIKEMEESGAIPLTLKDLER